jgi:hypothetical protein
MVLIAVDIHAAVFEVAKGWLTGTAPDIGEVHTLEESQFEPKR